MILYEEGYDNTLRRHTVLAKTIWVAFDGWFHADGLNMTVSDPAIRSHAVTSIEAKQGNGTKLQNWVKQNVGLTLGRGLGMAGEAELECHDFFRIGHMGHVNGHMIMGALGAIDAGLKALNIPHGTGALEAASSVISSSTKDHGFART